MAQRAIREYDAKHLLAEYLRKHKELSYQYPDTMVMVTPEKSLLELAEEYPWLNKERLVVKPDQLFGKRAKNGLVLVDASLKECRPMDP